MAMNTRIKHMYVIIMSLIQRKNLAIEVNTSMFHVKTNSDEWMIHARKKDSEYEANL